MPKGWQPSWCFSPYASQSVGGFFGDQRVWGCLGFGSVSPQGWGGNPNLGNQISGGNQHLGNQILASLFWESKGTYSAQEEGEPHKGTPRLRLSTHGTLLKRG